MGGHATQPFYVGGVPVLPGIGGLGVVAFRKVYFVDNRLGFDGNTGLGTGGGLAFKTVQRALNVVEDEDTIIVFKGVGNYDEKLTTGQNIRYAAMVPGRGRNVTLAGASPTYLPYNSPQLYNVSGSEYTLFIRSPGWRVTGLRILGDTGAPRGILAEMAQAANTAGTNWAPGLQIDHCTIYGYVDTSNAGFVSSAIADCRVFDNLFEGFGSSTLAAMGEETDGSLVTQPGFTFPQYQIRGNVFKDNKLSIKVPCQSSTITHNTIGQNRTRSVASYGGIDLNGGSGDNLISQNVLANQYESGGQYRRAASTDEWGGNIVTGGVVNGVLQPPFTSTHPDQ